MIADSSKPAIPGALNAASHVAKIEVRLSELTQLFNSMDPSPFNDKDLDDEADEWIVSSAKEEPEDAPLQLVIHLQKPEGVAGELEQATTAVHNHFTRKSELAAREFRELLRVGRKSLVIGLTVVAASVLIGDALEKLLLGSRFAQVVKESFLIGGWVAMWRPIEIFLYSWWPVRRKRRICDRLAEMEVKLLYCGVHCEHKLLKRAG